MNNSLKDLDTSNLIQLNYLAGVVDNEKLKYLQKTVFRVSRGNIFTVYVNLKDSDSLKNENRRISKSRFFVKFQLLQMLGKLDFCLLLRDKVMGLYMENLIF